MSDNIVQSQLMMAQSFGALTGALNNTKTMQTSTRDVVATLTVPGEVTAITVSGVTTVGDGEAGLYTRVAADPGAVEKVQSADGSWFQLAQPNSISSGIISSGSSITAATTVVAGTSISAGTFINAATEYRVAGNKVLGAQITGWATPTGTLTRATFTSNTVTLTSLAAHVAQLIIDLKTHGLITT
jgi:hypothetical protein